MKRIICFNTILFLVGLICLSCESEENVLSKFNKHIDDMYKNLVKDAEVEEISVEEYQKVNGKEVELNIDVGKSIIQKIGGSGNVIYEKREIGGSIVYRKVSGGKTDDEFRKKLQQVSLVLLTCYNVNKNEMDEKCKQEKMLPILGDNNSSDISEVEQNTVVSIDTVNTPFVIKKIHQ